MTINRNYGQLNQAETVITYAPVALDTTTGTNYSPTEAQYLAAGWKKVVDSVPTPSAGTTYRAAEWTQDSTTITRQYAKEAVSYSTDDPDGIVTLPEHPTQDQIASAVRRLLGSIAIVFSLGLTAYGNVTPTSTWGSIVPTNKVIDVMADVGLPTTNSFAAVSNTVAAWETYWTGDKVRLSVTNYYGNTSGDTPRLRIEEFDHSITNNGVVSNFYRTVWDEATKYTNFVVGVDGRISSISSSVVNASWQQTNLQLANKAPRAWQTVSSAGGDAPENTVWMTAPKTVFAGGTEWAHVAVGEGSVAVLVDKGADVYTSGEPGVFRFQDESGQNFFGFDVRSSYTLGCRTDGISVGGENLVTLTYSLVSEDPPEVLHCTNLEENVWTELGTGEISWEQNPPEGTKICYINAGSSPQGFYKAQIQYAGGSKFITNMQADLAGGIAASNVVLGVVQSIYPTITSTGIVWRVKQ